MTTPSPHRRRHRILLACLALGALRDHAAAQTLIGSSDVGPPAVVQIDVSPPRVVSQATVTLPGAIIASVPALASHPDTGVLFGVVAEARCPGDTSRTRVTGCFGITNDATACSSAFQINEGMPVSCTPRQDGSCIPCVAANEGSTGCTNTCLVAPPCADTNRTFAGNGGCRAFDGQPATCVQKFTLGECGPVPCFVQANGTTCSRCTLAAEALGQCAMSTCATPRSRDPIHLTTIDPVSGVATSIGDLGEVVSGITFSCDGRLFGVTGARHCTAAPDRLFAIDPGTATLTPRLTLGNTDTDASLTFDASANAILLAQASLQDVLLLSIDPDTFAVTGRPVSGPAIAADAHGIAWQGSTGDILWATASSQGELFRVPADGASASLGSVGRPLLGLTLAGPVGACDVCGDGVQTGLETCDDGNAADGDCCSAACRRDAAGASCAAATCAVGTCAADGTCTQSPLTGFAGVSCALEQLGSPTVCALPDLPAKLRKTIRGRARKTSRLVAAAEKNPARAAKRVRAAQRQVDAIAQAVAKRRDAVGAGCLERLDALVAQIDTGLRDLD